MSHPSPEGCAACPAHNLANLQKLGVDMTGHDYVVALAGNPNTGKSTVFNALTGLRQHTGNWPGKTVTRAEGAFANGGQRYKLVDLPGTYSLLSSSLDEEVARDFLLFGQPDVVVVVVDATCLERNLNLVLQVLEITNRAVVCLNLMDEARRRGISVDPRRLARDLGVRVVAAAARYNEGMPELIHAIAEVARGEVSGAPHRVGERSPALKRAVTRLGEAVLELHPQLPNSQWVALRLLDGDERIQSALRAGELGDLNQTGAAPGTAPDASGPPAAAVQDPAAVSKLLELASQLRWQVGSEFHQSLMEAVYTEAARIADRAVTRDLEGRRFDLDRAIDNLVTSRLWGVPLMLAMLTGVFWLTITGANAPSAMLATLLIDWAVPVLRSGAAAIGAPWWLSGFVIDGMYLATAWVVSVMLPPMAIFFPLFTLLEDFGYLPRVAFNLDRTFRRAGAHGKQALTMAMGWGCNAAGVVAARIIESPRERLIAIITNNFAICNGRWPTQILVATIFVGGAVPAHWAGLISALAVVGVAVFGVVLTFATSWLLSRTMLRGEVSAFSLELPPYRPPRVLATLYTSLIDRTLYVLWRAVVFALPAGAVIWLVSNIPFGDASLAAWLVQELQPFGAVLGLSGVILLAYIVAIPANEIVVPTILMLTVLVTGVHGVGAGAGVMFELDSTTDTAAVLRAGGWTLLTAVSLMLFSLVHNPCSTTIYTIWKETRSVKWTTVSALLPLGMGFLLCFVVAQTWRLVMGMGAG
ncbi:MAG TPA: ferrous iron transport protein B [Vicinamibacterales bacterium]|nr:ferrous iron transport protein B [Vicinamibacterales bacterium]